MKNRIYSLSVALLALGFQCAYANRPADADLHTWSFGPEADTHCRLFDAMHGYKLAEIQALGAVPERDRCCSENVGIDQIAYTFFGRGCQGNFGSSSPEGKLVNTGKFCELRKAAKAEYESDMGSYRNQEFATADSFIGTGKGVIWTCERPEPIAPPTTERNWNGITGLIIDKVGCEVEDSVDASHNVVKFPDPNAERASKLVWGIPSVNAVNNFQLEAEKITATDTESESKRKRFLDLYNYFTRLRNNNPGLDVMTVQLMRRSEIQEAWASFNTTEQVINGMRFTIGEYIGDSAITGPGAEVRREAVRRVHDRVGTHPAIIYAFNHAGNVAGVCDDVIVSDEQARMIQTLATEPTTGSPDGDTRPILALDSFRMLWVRK